MPAPSMASRIGIMVATNGMLSSTEEITADATSKMIMVNSTSSPVKSMSAFASMSMVPVSTMPPTMMNRPQKNVSVVHSTCQQRLRNIDAGNEHDDGGGGKGDNRRLDTERAVAHEADNHAHEHDDRNLQQTHVFDLLFRVELEHAVAIFVGESCRPRPYRK